jgi:hypothetical protein
MIETKAFMEKSTDIACFSCLWTGSGRLAYPRTTFHLVLRFGASDVVNNAVLFGGWSVKSARIAFFNVVQARPGTNSISMTITAVDKFTPLCSLNLERHLILPH